ncbi:fibronectin type III domain-containing protein [Marinitoga litoralis]|uniref:fibronectin type III domain-containing protein n=1 Tax=Marinitoga litoralis TaxID=570855 RepID=UPI001960ECB4|nr:PQQ-binding-like beta-propeller repeat protein [Marinitoga litoralis]MBM7559998.1 hypothetical protein [Marinitoga litoralis]
MKNLYLSIFLILLFIFQSCIFKNQPPIIENMSPSDTTITSDTVNFNWIAKDPEGGVLYYNFFLNSNDNTIKKSLELASNSLKIEGLDDGDYEWIIQAFDTSGNKSEKKAYFKVAVPNNSPTKSFLIYPENNNNSVNPYNLTFKWNKSIDFDGDYVFYNLYLSDSTPLTTPIATNLNTTEYTIKKLELNTTYYWMVETYDSNGASEISNIWSFKTVDNTPPIVDFPKKEYVIKENETFELDLSNYISDMEDTYFEYQIITNNGAYIEGNKYVFKPKYDIVKHPNLERKIHEQILVSDTKGNSTGYLNLKIIDVNQYPNKPEVIYPLNNSIVPENIKLKWKCSDPDGDSLKYDIFLRDDSNDYTKIATDLTKTEFDLYLLKDTKYYLKIVAKDSYGGIIVNDEITFKTKKSENTLEWKIDIPNILDMFVYNQKLLVISENGVYRLNTNGSEDKFISLNNLIENSIIFENLLFVPDNSGNIYVIDLETFKTVNTLSVSGNIAGITASKDYKNNKYMYVALKNGNLIVYDIDTLEIFWENSYDILPSNPPLIIENGYIVLWDNNSLLWIKPKGKIFKKIEFNQSISSLISTDESSNIYFAIGKTVYSYNKDGAKNWELSLSENIENEILYDGEYLYASSKNKIFKIDINGNLVDSYGITNVFSKTLLISESKDIYGITSNGIFKNNSETNIDSFNNVKTCSLLNDSLLYFANDNTLYSISISERNILNDKWSKFGKNINNNRNLYIRNNTPPEKPLLTYPKNQSIEVPIKIKLTWECEDLQDDVLTYSIYLGEEDNLNLIATTNATSYEVNLENNKTYYWKVVVSDGELETESDMYKFNTIPSPSELKFKVKVEGATIYSPAISEDNIIYFSTSSGNIYAYDSYGLELWKYETNGFIKSPVVLNPLNQIIVGNDNGELYIINSDGTISNSITLDGSISKPVALSGYGEIYVITDNGNIYKLSAFGNILWKKQLNGAPTTNIIVDNDDNIYFGLNNHLYSLDTNGNEIFKISFNRIISTELSMDNNENIYFATEDNKIYSINKLGKIEFEKTMQENISKTILIAEDNSIVFGTQDGNLHQYYYLSDDIRSIELKDLPYSYILMDNVKYITTKNKFIVYNGSLKWNDEYRKIRYSPNIDNNGVVIFGTSDGYLYGVYGETPKLRDSPWPISLGDKKHTGNINKNITMPSNRPPLKPYNPYPQNNSEITLSNITLSWESSDPDGDTVYYDVYFGDKLTQELIAQKLTKKEYTISNLIEGTYYWYVKAYDDKGNISKSDLWVFTVKKISGENNPPLKPTLLEPANNSENIPINVNLKWSCSDPDGDTLTYDIYIEKEPILSIPKEINYTQTSYNIILEPGQTYYWKIVAKDGKGGEKSSDIYSFTTAEKVNNPPNKPQLLSPPNNATDIESDVTLVWNASDPDRDTLTYDVYLDKTQNFSSPYKSNISNTSLLVTGLELGTTYYWKVVAKDGKGGENTSNIYSFTVKDSIGPLTPKLYFKDVTVNSGEQGELIIHAQKLENVMAFVIEINYDNEKLQINEISGINLNGVLIPDINTEYIKIDLLNPGQVFNINDNDIIKIKFTAIGSPGITEVKFTSDTKFFDKDSKEIDIDISDIGIITIN